MEIENGMQFYDNNITLQNLKVKCKKLICIVGYNFKFGARPYLYTSLHDTMSIFINCGKFDAQVLRLDFIEILYVSPPRACS